MDVNTSVTEWTVTRLEIRLAKLWVMIHACGFTDVARGVQRSQRTIKLLLLQLLLILFDVSRIVLLTTIHFRIKFAIDDGLRDLLIL